MLTIGLTGGIGSGKTSAAAIFSQLNIATINADQVTRELMSRGGAAYPALQFWLGRDYFDPDGELDRSKLRKLVFNTPAKLTRLEAIVHPLVAQEFVARLNNVPESSAYAVLEIPLLTEKHKTNLVNRVLVVDCSEDTQIRRSSERDNTNADEIRKIIAQQMPRQERLALADDVINNDGNLDELATQIKALHQIYLGLATDRH